MADTKILELTQSELIQYLSCGSGTMLVDLWAPWCGPCRALTATLEAFAKVETKSLKIAKVNVDKYPEVLTVLRARSIPTMVLLRDGKEMARCVGSRSLSQLRQWLCEQDVPLEIGSHPRYELPRFGAFYGDEQLRDHLVARLRSAAVAGAIMQSFMPYWADGAGSPSASLVHNADPSVFERVTGMPVSFACVMEFVGITTADQVEEVFENVKAGMDLSTVSLRLIIRWLSTNENEWSAILNDAELDKLRERWLHICSRYVDGDIIDVHEWSSLRLAAENMRSDRDPYREVHDDVVTIIATLSPPPKPNDASAWSTAILVHANFSRARLAEFRLGWSVEDRATPTLRNRWLAKRVPRDAEGQRDQDLLNTCNAQWMMENESFIKKEKYLVEHNAEIFEPFNIALRKHLLEILSDILVEGGQA